MSQVVGSPRGRSVSSALPWDLDGRSALTGAWWARGLSLAERMAAAGGPRPADPGDVLALRADRRLELWRDAYPALTEDTADLQVRAYGGGAALLRDLLAEPADRLAARTAKPRWASEVERVVAGMSSPGATEPVEDAAGEDAAGEDAAGEDAAGEDAWRSAFARIVEPFVLDAGRRFLTRASSFAAVADVSAIAGDLEDGLAVRLVAMAARVLVLELNVARVTGRLLGETPQERFRSFVRQCQDPAGFATLLDEYVVLARALATCADQAVEAHLEFLGRLAADRGVIVARLFDGTDPGRLCHVRFGRGDHHGDGRSVGIATFTSGRRAVYKPRPVAVHQHFNELIHWFNGRLPADAALFTLTVLARGEYGWVEYVEPRACRDAADVDRYFLRQGLLLAVFYALAAVDMHFENLIAVGDQPVVVDLESVFHAGLPMVSGSAFTDDDPAARAYRESVAQVGLLPTVLFGADGRVFDVGGMGGDRNVELPFAGVDWTDAGTDRMRISRRPFLFPGSQNRASLEGVDLEPREHAARLLEGFRLGYGVLAAHRDQLLGDRGLAARFRDDEVRVIVRATREYAHLLDESSHPDVGRDALDRDLVYGLLWAGKTADPARSRLARHEVARLWAGDVPLFTARAGSRDLATDDGHVIHGILPETGLERAERIIRRLGVDDLARQEWIITGHLAGRAGRDVPQAARAARVTRVTRAARTGRPGGIGDGGRTLEERALRLARVVGDRLASRAVVDGSRIGWLGLGLVQEVKWSAAPLQSDLYNGYPGVALFFAQLAAVTQEQRYADLADRVLRPLGRYVEDTLLAPAAQESPDQHTPIGAFSGLSGLAYVFACCSRLRNGGADRETGRELVTPLLERVAAAVPYDDTFDVIGGSAGALAVAEALVPRHGAPAERVARVCAERLVTFQLAVGAGAAWPGTGSRPLLGFSHGAAGIGWALLKHAARTGDERARATGRAAFAYERGEYRADAMLWPDFRGDGLAGAGDMHAWCHGAPGIGLARATIPASERHPAAGDDLRLALEGVEARGRFGNSSLCHGDLGNTELLAATRDGSLERDLCWYGHVDSVLTELETRGLVCGTPDGIETPGLMPGLAGIGHGLLRIAAPDAVPPVLLLAVEPGKGPSSAAGGM